MARYESGPDGDIETVAATIANATFVGVGRGLVIAIPLSRQSRVCCTGKSYSPSTCLTWHCLSNA